MKNEEGLARRPEGESQFAAARKNNYALCIMNYELFRTFAVRNISSQYINKTNYGSFKSNRGAR